MWREDNDMQWSVEQLQLALFYPPNITQDAYQTWLSLFQSSPDTYQRHPDPSLRASNAGGQMYGYNWSVQNSPGRSDIILNGAPTSGTGFPPETFPLVAKDEVATKLLMERLALIQSDQLGVLRVALVVQFVVHVPTLHEANKLFFAETGIAPIESEVSDLIFSVNCRRPLKNSGVKANRLCRWQSIEKQFVAMQLGAFNDFSPTVVQPAIIMNVDINTVPQQISFKPSEIAIISDDLYNEVVRIRKEGYNALVD